MSLAVLPFVAACDRSESDASKKDEAVETPESAVEEAAESAEAVALLKEATVSEAAARSAALARVVGGEVTKVELEREDDLLVWSLDVKVAGKEGVEEVHVDAKTGAVVSQVHETDAELTAEAAEDAQGQADDDDDEADEDDEDDEAGPSQAELLKTATVTEAAARATALARVPGGAVTKSELEQEDNLLIWSFDIKVAGKEGVEEVHVDAKTGKVVKQEHEGGVTA